jgi:two-component system, NtrC family, C4-dicarboxylate transport sensor histidine kinase DctB
MIPEDPKNSPAPAENVSVESLLREKEELSQQVKRLIRAEGTLYEYQQVLDAQLKEYKELYDFTRRLNNNFDLSSIFDETVRYIVQELEYERAIILRREEATGIYRVCALDGYYDRGERDVVSALTISHDTPCLSSLVSGKEYVICSSSCQENCLRDLRSRLLINEYLFFPLGPPPVPPALLAVGNSAENASFYRKIEASRDALLGLGNLAGLISSVIGNRISLEQTERAREQERVAEARYRSIFENAIEGIFQRSPAGFYLNVNPSYARMLGYDSALELIALITNIREQLYVDPGYHDKLVALLNEQGSVEAFEVELYRKDRSIIWASISMRSVFDSEGKLLYYEGTAENITERKRGEAALKESERKYRQLSEALEERVREAVNELRQKDKILILQGRQAVMGEMISNIAHQWRQPLNMLALLIQDLQMTRKRVGLTEEFFSENVNRSLEIIRQMSKTIDYFRYFFKPDKDKVEFRVLETIEKTVSILNGSFKIHGIRTEVEHTGDPVINGFPTEFVQVLLNILINARDALQSSMPEDPFITVRLFEEGKKTVVTITDNAGGIPEEIIDKIFDPYFTTKGPDQGTGIGLFMSKTIIEKNMHGQLSVRNVRDGAEFRIEV